MKINRRSVGLFIILSVLLMLVVPIGIKNMIVVDSGREDSSGLEESIITLDRDDYTNYTGPSYLIASFYYRIYIDDFNYTQSWAVTAADNDWCSGSGTVLDPYVIEGLYINAYGGGGIIIAFSQSHFVIRNCWIDNDNPNFWDIGVKVLSNYNNSVRIENNTFTNFYFGIHIAGSAVNSTIQNNIMINQLSDNINNGRAIEVGAESHNMKIIGNIIVNYHHGMWGGGNSDNFTIEGNYMENNLATSEKYPIYLRNSDYSKIINNTLAGLFAYGSFKIKNNDGAGNIVEFNEVIANSTDFIDTTLFISSELTTQQTTENVIKLDGCHFNYIGYNRMLLPAVDSDPDPDPDPDPITPSTPEALIGGYDAILVFGIAFFTVLTIVLKRRKR